MKRIILLLISLSIAILSIAQTDSIPPTPSEYAGQMINEIQATNRLDSLTEEIQTLVNNLLEIKIRDIKSNKYKMYPTQNIYNLLKLDTQTGKIEQVQWSLKANQEFSTYINIEDLSIYNSINSFELYPTQNMYQFILLDKCTGRTWHVQWGLSSKERWIRRIY